MKNLIDFVEFNHEFRKIIRVARIPNDSRMENDAEHCFQLALTAWYLIETEHLKLNKEKVLLYALSHDLVEVYAGDTFTFDKKANLTKQKREKAAIKKISKRFPNFKSLIKNIEEYESQKNKESKFVYALDKLIPPIQVYLERGKLWREQNCSFMDVIENKDPKIKKDLTIQKYWKEIRSILEANKRKFFDK